MMLGTLSLKWNKKNNFLMIYDIGHHKHLLVLYMYI